MDQPAVRAPEFPTNLDWINTAGRALTLADLRGKVALLDFWTYGWINCIHVIPQLRELEHRFPREVVIIGVHSGKYHAERVTERIREAAIRLGNAHAILNDRQFRTWRSYAVNAWPTLAVVDPSGRALGTLAGEFTADQMTPVVQELIDAFDRAGRLDRGELPLRLDEPAIAPGLLRYPGKVALDGAGGDGARIAIADTGHHRVLVGRLTRQGTAARVERIIGDGEPGFADGEAGRLDAPYGVAFDGDTLYIADAGAHAVRAADLAAGTLRTVAGIGRQLRTMDDLRRGAMSSPWDVAVADGVLYVAMAGIHQLWSIELATGTGRVHSGTRHEDIVDGPHHEAALAQPMGIVAAGDRLYFADAESSAVRWADRTPGGAVGTIVGTGLFDFGDRDGVGDDALLQHPQGLARHPDGRLLVADSYNDALKWVDPTTRRVETWVRGLHEPAGVACGDRFAYIADTNAHRVATVEYATGEVGELGI